MIFFPYYRFSQVQENGLNKNDEIHKDLRILKLDNFPSLIIPQTTGKPPGERFGHSMALNNA